MSAETPIPANPPVETGPAKGEPAPAKIAISANLPVETVQQLRWLASKTGATMTEVLRRAVNNETFFRDVSERGGKVLTEDSKGTIREIIIR